MDVVAGVKPFCRCANPAEWGLPGWKRVWTNTFDVEVESKVSEGISRAVPSSGKKMVAKLTCGGGEQLEFQVPTSNVLHAKGRRPKEGPNLCAKITSLQALRAVDRQFSLR